MEAHGMPIANRICKKGSMTTPILALRGIRKAYPSVLALDGVDLAVQPGEIHAVLGENGAGKSTLMKIIYGAVRPDAGTMEWRGRVVRVHSPGEARELGIAMVFQHFALFESITVVENIALALAGPFDLKALASRIAEVSQRYGLPLNPWRHVHELSVGERQRVEIVRCLLQSPKLLIMDEPTSVLTPQAVEQLFGTLRTLAGEGTAIVYVSHKLDEIRRLCHRATIFRAGRRVGEVDPAKETEESLAAMMIGREFPRMQRRSHTPGEVALELVSLSVPADGPFGTPLREVNLRVHAGEIVGIAGVSGNGQAELLEAITGERLVADSGAVRLAGQPAGRLGTTRRRELGLVHVPEERLGRGTVPPMSLSENALLTAYRHGMVRHGLVMREPAAAFTNACIEGFDVRCGGLGAKAQSLSGGNLQKFIVGREMRQKPRLMVVAQPTWGVDVAATALIRQQIVDLAAQGVAVLIVSEDLGEILETCDRVAVIAGGRVSPVKNVFETSAEEIGRWMAGMFPGGPAMAAKDAERVPA
ncbi:MAG: ABC transporter ATP-binding protein [Betaproteobacteria bacterium]|nr:ABC transporter ATP-binding protein [Betaproteobacteria bacterium]